MFTVCPRKRINHDSEENSDRYRFLSDANLYTIVYVFRNFFRVYRERWTASLDQRSIHLGTRVERSLPWSFSIILRGKSCLG